MRRASTWCGTVPLLRQAALVRIDSSQVRPLGGSMAHFVAYHNEDRMGYSAEESDPYSLYTSKNPTRLHSHGPHVIWVIAGRGHKPMSYYLSTCFIVTAIIPADHPDFGYTISGTGGGRFEPMPRLDQLTWFPEFRRRMANFSIGLTEICNEEIIEEFQRFAAHAGHVLG